MRIGSLFSGAGGLDMAVEAVFGGTTVWHAEIDKGASKVLAYRWPEVPNLGDITEINWSNWKPLLEVDILCGGYPCQPFSAAGQRKGTDDDRHLWPYFAAAICVLRPRFVVLENVAGHRSMGFDSVLADLAEARYDAQWCSVRASDVGAPHRRERLFVLATDTGNDGRPGEENYPCGRESDVAGCDCGCEPGGCGTSFSGGANSSPVDLLPTPTQSDGTGGGIRTGLSWEGTTKSTGDGGNSRLRDVVGLLLPTPRSSDCFGAGLHGDGGMDLRTTVSLLPTPNAVDGHPTSAGRHSTAKHPTLNGEVRLLPNPGTQWGKYEPAICRWEQLTRPAPAPTEPNKNGNPRLSAAFSEWLMGWPDGWVTDPAIGISRNDQLRIVGNGVCPQQAAAALRYLLAVAEVSA
jgi:DNA (cytosine-5)-methyltransferase 1